MLKYWQTQTSKEKLFIVIIAGLLIFGIVTYIKYELANYRLIKTQKIQLGVYRDSLTAQKELLIEYISSGKKINTHAKKKAQDINKKLKNDTQKINNSAVSDNELSEFLSNYEKKAINQ